MKKLFLFLLLSICLLQILVADPVFRQAKDPQEETTGFSIWKKYIYTFTDSEMKSSEILVIIDNQYQESSASNGTFKITLKKRPASIKLYYPLSQDELSYTKSLDRSVSKRYRLEYTFTGKEQYNNKSVNFLVYLSEVKDSRNNIQPEIRSVSAKVTLGEKQIKDLGIDTTKDTYDNVIAAVID